MLNTTDLLFLAKTRASALFKNLEHPWEALPLIRAFIEEIGPKLSEDEFYSPYPQVWVSRKATLSESAVIQGPCIIDGGSELRHCAFIRGCALIGRGCVVGNSVELKNVILFDGVKVPHLSYVGDSILGYMAHMGAGAVTSNVKICGGAGITVRFGNEEIETGLRKFGAVIGDYSQIGCNCVLNPGTVIGRNTVVYPLSNVRGAVEADSIYKAADNIVRKNGARRRGSPSSEK